MARTVDVRRTPQRGDAVVENRTILITSGGFLDGVIEIGQSGEPGVPGQRSSRRSADSTTMIANTRRTQPAPFSIASFAPRDPPTAVPSNKAIPIR